MNRFSILYGENSGREVQVKMDNNALRDDGQNKYRYDFKNILDDLNLREISGFTNLSNKDIDFVLNIASDFNSSEQDVKMRLGIIKDFLNIRGFYDMFDSQMRHFVDLREKLANAKRNMMRVHADVSAETSFLNYNKIVHACSFFSLTYRTVFNLYREFKDPKTESPRFLELAGFLEELVENTQFKQLNEECKIFCDHINEGVIFDVDIKMNSILRIISLRLTDFRYVKPVQTGLFYSVMRALAIEEKTEENKKIYIDKKFTRESLISNKDDAYLKGGIEYQINLTARRLAAIYETLIDLFSDIYHELVFYKYAVNMTGYMKASGIPYCLPEISDTNNINAGGCSAEIEGLCDITLATAFKNAEAKFEVVQNDYILNPEDKINIITGANQSGKTTFLRALGSALIFARAGLPVPAVRAKINLFRNLYSHFQRYDEDLKNEGQLDTELAEMSAIVYSAGKDSIVLMNESFSSTGLKDAAQIASDVLSAFSHTGVKVIYVTHIPGMKSKLSQSGNLDPESKENIKLYKTGQKNDGSPSFKLESVTM